MTPRPDWKRARKRAVGMVGPEIRESRGGLRARRDDERDGAGVRGGLQPSFETNRTGNERDGEQFRRIIDRHGQEIHIYEDGRRVVDKSPGSRTFQPVDGEGRRDGTGNDAALTPQDPPLYTGTLANPVSVASPYEADLVRHVRQRIARNGQRSRGR